ncbi:hypothetical protein Ahy_B05g074933 [Arachis hypogaea]|uniref:Uncharacterized protein n=1 Tax=Arachis hypogaea TaxID=3818 RepID=A0A444Z0H2_ARAHY|nr:hypothetical protein Ahy_B05g074933 [Arachis hypogaea]
MENHNRNWMYDRTYDQRRGLKPSFIKGVNEFVDVCTRTHEFLRGEHGEEIPTENQIRIEEDIESSSELGGVTWEENFDQTEFPLSLASTSGDVDMIQLQVVDLQVPNVNNEEDDDIENYDDDDAYIDDDGSSEFSD